MTVIVASIVFGGIAAGFIAFLTARRLHTQGLLYTPTFYRMSSALGLSRKQARVLAHLAQQTKIAAPATLLISRGNFDRATRLASSHDQAQALNNIRRQLFD